MCYNFIIITRFKPYNTERRWEVVPERERLGAVTLCRARSTSPGMEAVATRGRFTWSTARGVFVSAAPGEHVRLWDEEAAAQSQPGNRGEPNRAVPGVGVMSVSLRHTASCCTLISPLSSIQYRSSDHKDNKSNVFRLDQAVLLQTVLFCLYKMNEVLLLLFLLLSLLQLLLLLLVTKVQYKYKQAQNVSVNCTSVQNWSTCTVHKYCSNVHSWWYMYTNWYHLLHFCHCDY